MVRENSNVNGLDFVLLTSNCSTPNPVQLVRECGETDGFPRAVCEVEDAVHFCPREREKWASAWKISSPYRPE